MFPYLKPLLKDWFDKRLYLISEKPDKPAVTAVWEDLQSPVAFPSWDRVSDFFLLFRNCVHQLIRFRLRGPTQRQGSSPHCCYVLLIWKEVYYRSYSKVWYCTVWQVHFSHRESYIRISQLLLLKLGGHIVWCWHLVIVKHMKKKYVLLNGKPMICKIYTLSKQTFILCGNRNVFVNLVKAVSEGVKQGIKHERKWKSSSIRQHCAVKKSDSDRFWQFSNT